LNLTIACIQTLKHQFESKIEVLNQEKQGLESNLHAKDQNMKNAELEYSAKWQNLKNQLDEARKLEDANSKEYNEELRAQELKHHYQVNQLQDQLIQLQAELKVKMVQGGIELSCNNEANFFFSLRRVMLNAANQKQRNLVIVTSSIL
jgi:predicted nuclease with TOPRIM domain